MCGIVGLVNYKHNIETNLEKMKSRMIRRGPDSEGSYISPDGLVALGHRRLAVIDVGCGGNQPMQSHNHDYVMVFNGEIYNHPQIKEKLIDEGFCNKGDFVGSSDTEVLLEAVSAYGVEKAVSLAKGMFGIAIYDLKRKELYLIRDRIGEKPLYYGRVKEAFVFASDIASLAVIDGFDNQINEQVLGMYFTLGYIPTPYTIYKDIYKLNPGCILKINVQSDTICKEEIHKYWSMDDVALNGQMNPFSGSFEEATDELERLLKNSVSGQMVADVPVGAFLSAGIDSSTCVALMQSISKNSVNTFTIGMENSDYNEAVYAKKIADCLGTSHKELYISEQDAKDVIPQIAHMFGEPFADSSQIPTYLVSKMTREHVTVSLSGDGGDELFGGYDTYRSLERIWGNMHGIPCALRKPLSRVASHIPMMENDAFRIKSALLGASGIENLYNISRYINAGYGNITTCKNMLQHPNELYKQGYLDSNSRNLMLMDMDMYHPDDILVKVDRTAMAVSLETRVPMLDRDVVEFAWTLPTEYLRDDRVGKKVLREVLYRYVPKEMMERPKTGFAIPIDSWLRNDKELRSWAEQLIDKKLLMNQGYLDADVVWKLWNNLVEKGIWKNQIWSVLIFQQWLLSRES